jgi:hypothetical protein
VCYPAPRPAGSHARTARAPALGLTHLQLEALLTAARLSPNRYDLALVCLLGMLGLRIFEATGPRIADVGEEHGHRVVRVLGKGARPSSSHCRRPSDELCIQAIGERIAGPILLDTPSARMHRHARRQRA